MVCEAKNNGEKYGFIPQKKTQKKKKQMVTLLHFLNKSSILRPWKHFYHLQLFTMHDDLKKQKKLRNVLLIQVLCACIESSKDSITEMNR